MTVLIMLATAAAMLVAPTGPAAAKASPECAAGGVKVSAGASPATVSVSGTSVMVTITGTSFTIAPTDTGITLDSASWCLKASTKTQNGTGTTGTSTITNGKGVAQNIGYLTLYSVTVQTEPVVDQDGPRFNGGSFMDCAQHNQKLAQTFTAGRTGSLRAITLYIQKGTSVTLLVDIYATSGGVPTGTSLSATAYTGTLSLFDGSTIPLSQPVSLTQGVQYAIVFGPDCEASLESWSIGGGAYDAGAAWRYNFTTDAWESPGFSDWAFKTWMTG